MFEALCTAHVLRSGREPKGHVSSPQVRLSDVIGIMLRMHCIPCSTGRSDVRFIGVLENHVQVDAGLHDLQLEQLQSAAFLSTALGL